MGVRRVRRLTSEIWLDLIVYLTYATWAGRRGCGGPDLTKVSEVPKVGVNPNEGKVPFELGGIYSPRPLTALGPNKPHCGIAERTHCAKPGLPSVMGTVSGCGNGKANKLDTQSRDQFSGSLLSRICRDFCWTYGVVSHRLRIVKNQHVTPIR